MIPVEAVYAPDSRIVIVADVQVAGGVEGDSNRVIQTRRSRWYVVSVIARLTGAGNHSENLSRTVDFHDLVVTAVRDINVPERIDSDVRRTGEFVVGRGNAIVFRFSTTGVGRYEARRRLGSQRARHTYQSDKRNRPAESTRHVNRHPAS